MLDIWFNPIFCLSNKENLSNIGNSISINEEKKFPDLSKITAAFIGIDEKKAQIIRDLLFSYDWQFDGLKIADLGNTKKEAPDFLIPIFHELIQAEIVPIVFGADFDTAAGQFLAFKEAKTVVNVVSVDSLMRQDSLFYKKMHHPSHPILFHFAAMGYQSPLISLDYAIELQQRNYDVVRLGKSRDALKNSEPIIRDADFFSFHLSAIRASDAPGVANQSPAGYTIEEACQLCRYAGMSDKLTSFGIYGFEPSLDRDNLTAQTVAQMIWYFLEGLAQRKNDYPISTDGMVEYLVEFREQKLPITFWKSNKSGRWWVQVVEKTAKKLKRHHLVPCAFSDYQEACQGELSDKVLQAMQRFS